MAYESTLKLNTLKLNKDQLTLVKEIIDFYAAQEGAPRDPAIYRRSELKAAHLKLRRRTASPYFIAKNRAPQVIKSRKDKETGELVWTHEGYDLGRFIKYAEKHPVAAVEGEEVASTPKKRKTAKKATRKHAKKAVAAPEEETVGAAN
jgi:hypothetical protein